MHNLIIYGESDVLFQKQLSDYSECHHEAEHLKSIFPEAEFYMIDGTIFSF